MLKPVVDEVAGAPEWLAIYVTPKHEKRVAAHFQVLLIEHYLPLYTVQRKWRDGSKVTLQLPLFPGYVFVQNSKEVRRRIFEAPGVLSIVGKRESSIIPDSYIQFLRQGLLLNKLEPHASLATGKHVRIRTGALAGVEGVLIRKKTGFRVVLTVQAIMKNVAVEVGLDEIEALPSAPENTVVPPRLKSAR